MRKWITLSVLLHLLVFLLLWLGLPNLDKREIEPMQIVPIDIASVSDITAVKQAPPKPAEPKPETKSEPKPPEPTPPPKPPVSAEPEPKPTPQKVEDKPEPLPIPKPKPPKPEPPKKQDTLSSILKNVAKMKPEDKTPDKPVDKTEAETKPTPQKEPSPAPSPPQVPATAEHLSISEADALRRQLAQCWNFDPGAKGIESMKVDIYVSINQDRTVREAVVVDQARMATDAFFRSVAESAVRALKNPVCSPLALPPEKYQEWKDTVMTFNPKDM
jgi:hypothetical protein